MTERQGGRGFGAGGNGNGGGDVCGFWGLCWGFKGPFWRFFCGVLWWCGLFPPPEGGGGGGGQNDPVPGLVGGAGGKFFHGVDPESGVGRRPVGEGGGDGVRAGCEGGGPAGDGGDHQ